jgi:isoamylase
MLTVVLTFLADSDRGDGANFALFSRRATAIRLELYKQPAAPEPYRRIPLDPVRHRTGDIRHIWVQGLRSGQLYGYRVEGPFRPEEGHRFNSHKLLLDPYATAITLTMIPPFQRTAAINYDYAGPGSTTEALGL